MPSFLTPDFGLLFWMLIAFLVVLFILAKFGFPALINMVEERKSYIDESLQAARDANERLASIEQEAAAVMKEAGQQRAAILKEASATRDRIVDEAKQKAQAEANRIVEEARRQAQSEQEKALRQSRNRIAELGVEIASMLLGKQLGSTAEQEKWIEQYLDELKVE